MKEEIVLDTGLTRGQNSGLDREVWFKFDWFRTSALFRLVIHTDPSYPHQSCSRLQMMTPAGWSTIRAQQVPRELNMSWHATLADLAGPLLSTQEILDRQHNMLLGPAIAEAALVCGALCRRSLEQICLLHSGRRNTPLF